MGAVFDWAPCVPRTLTASSSLVGEAEKEKWAFVARRPASF